MPHFLVKRAAGYYSAGAINGKDSVIVYADNSADAITQAQTIHSSDSDAVWANATVTELTRQADMLGVEARAVITNASSVKKTYSFVGIAGSVLADLITGLTALMNADTTTFPSGVTASGLVITIAAGNNLGALTHTAGLFLPVTYDVPLTPGGPTPALSNYAMTTNAPVVNAAGVAGIARTITFTNGAYEGFRLRVQVADPTTPLDASVWFGTGETIDLAAARLVALINALSGSIVTHATYTAGTNLITIPGATDAQGAKVITASITMAGTQQAALLPTVNAAGLSSVDRTITLPADTVFPIPRVPSSTIAANIDGYVGL